MGRQVRRVPLDFNHPIDTVWPGFLMPADADPDTWQGNGPPEGDGWQLWETTSEGSPISPVFPTAEDLAGWMTRNRCTVSGPMPTTDAALRFIREGSAPTFVMGGGHIVSGAVAVGAAREGDR